MCKVCIYGSYGSNFQRKESTCWEFQMNLTTIKIINQAIGLKISVSSIFDVRATWWHPNKTEIEITLKFSPAAAYLLSRGCREDISSSGKPPGTRMTHKPIGEKKFPPPPTSVTDKKMKPNTSSGKSKSWRLKLQSIELPDSEKSRGLFYKQE